MFSFDLLWLFFSCSVVFRKFLFQSFDIIFGCTILACTTNDSASYGEASMYVFDWLRKFWKFRFVDIFQYFWLTDVSPHNIFCKFSVSIFELYFSVIWICWNQKPILFDSEKLTFMFSIDLKINNLLMFLNFHDFLGSGLTAFCILRFF